MKRLTTLLLCSTLFAMPASAQVFGDWDTDSDAFLTENEWGTGYDSAGLYGEWDADNDSYLTEPEFGGGLFSRFDTDNDGNLTIAEWDQGFDSWYGERMVNFEPSNWDDDGNGLITRAEFDQEYASAGIFNDFVTTADVDYDATAGIAEDDFGEGLFDWFDFDDDDQLAENEAGWF